MNVLVKHFAILLLALPLAVVFSCTVEPSQPLGVEEITSSIRYRATVGEGDPTRASINNMRQYVFELGDELYVTHEEGGSVKMFGVLSLVAGEGSTTGTFEGELMCLSGYTPKPNHVLEGRLVGKEDLLYDRKNGRLYGKGSTTETETSPIYPSNQYADSFEDALRKFSDFRGESTYGAHSFTLEQKSAFLIFSVTFDEMDSPPENVIATISLNKADNTLGLSASVPVDNSMEFPHVNFVASVAGGMELNSASFTISGEGLDYDGGSIDNDNNSATSFTLAENRYYNINRTTINDEYFTIRATENSAHITFNFGQNRELKYKKKSDVEWTVPNTDNPSVELGAKELIQVQAIADDYASTGLFTLGDGESCLIYGDIMSLLCDPGYVRKTTVNNSAFIKLFKGINVDIPSGRPLKLGGSVDNPVTSLGTNCFESMFQDCVTLTRPPEFPNTNIPSSACLNMFNGCTSLQSAPDLPASTVGNNGYKNMFYGCTALSSAPTSIAGDSGTVGASGCESMFQGCTSLSSAPLLPSLSVGNSGYKNMFNGCTSLIASPSLNATTIGTYVYDSMFEGCTALASAPSILPAVTLKEYCYRKMFYGCTSLTSVPDLPATNADNAANVYYQMFSGCIALNLSTKTSWNLGLVKTGASGCYQMFYGCQSLVQAPLLSALTNVGASGCFEMFRGCKELRNVPSGALPAETLAQQCYQSMFQDCISLVSAPSLPANTLAKQCYQSMFQDCTKLTSTPTLSATSLAQQCYQSMFQGCTKLESTPATLPATTLAKQCYQSMFQGCTKLTTAPSLPAETLAQQCYQSMFQGCTKLESTPATLPATTLAKQCYQSMFQGCTTLASAPDLPAATSAVSCYQSMFEGCKALTTGPSSLPITTVEVSACQNMFKNCSSLIAAPTLSSITSVYNYGCREMFSGCSLMTAPPQSLPATTINKQAYYQMFYNCTALTSIPDFPCDPNATYSLYSGTADKDGVCYQMFFRCNTLTSLSGKKLFNSSTIGAFCFQDMFSECARLATVPNDFLPALTLAESCYRGMFQSTAITEAPDLLAPALVTDCYRFMFNNCKSLIYIKCYSTAPGSESYTKNWLDKANNSLAAEFHYRSGVDWPRTVHGIPDTNNWSPIADTVQ